MADKNNNTGSMVQSAGQMSEDLQRRQMPKANAFIRPMAVVAPSSVQTIPTTLPRVETAMPQNGGGVETPSTPPATTPQANQPNNSQASQSRQNTQQPKGVGNRPTPQQAAQPSQGGDGGKKQQPQAAASGGSAEEQKLKKGVKFEVPSGGEQLANDAAKPTANLDYINAFRANMGLKPVHIASSMERQKAKYDRQNGERVVKATMNEAERKANKKTWRDWLFGSKTDEEWNKKRKEKIAAVGDFLKNLGNLYGTINGAPSMKFESAYDKLKAEHVAADKAAKDRAFKQQEADRDYSIALGGLNVKQSAEHREQELQPHKLAQAIATANEAKTKAETERAMQKSKIEKAAGDADLAKEKVATQQEQTNLTKAKTKGQAIENQYKPGVMKSQTNAHNASAANSYASAETQKARKKQLLQSIKNNGDVTFSSRDPNKNWLVPKKDVNVLARELQGIARRKKWGKDFFNFDGTLKKGASAEDLLVAAYENIDDADVQKTIGRRAKLVKATTSSKNPVYTTLK